MRLPILALLSLSLLTPALGCRTLGKISRTPLAGARSTPPKGIDKRVRQVGETAPDVSLPNDQGGRFSLKNALESGPAVLVFYRGDW